MGLDEVSMGLNWAYGVTTVPQRLDELLPNTLKSLSSGGFPEPRLFVDNAPSPDPWIKFGLSITSRYPTIGAFGNWILALAELYLRNPKADRYALFQDDFITYRNLRDYLEAVPYPDMGYLNLYTFPQNQALCPVGPDKRQQQGWYLSDQCGKGAVALVFSIEAVRILLSHRNTVQRPLDARRGHKWIDGHAVTVLRKEGWKEYVHNPSLVQHMGRYTTIRGNKPHQIAHSFKGPEFDARLLIPG